MTYLNANLQTFLDVLRWRAKQQPHRAAYLFLDSELAEQGRLTYENLDRRARMCAAKLAAVARPGDRVMIACPSGLEYVIAVFACFYAGAVAVNVPVPRGSRGMVRFFNVLKDANPVGILSTSAVIAQIRKHDKQIDAHGGPVWMTVSDEESGNDPAIEPVITPADTAVLQYTSGSTRDPRGVILSHSNLTSNSRMLQETFGYSERSFCVSWLPLYHDMGLIGSILQPLFGGFPCALMSPSTFLQDPVQWLRAISLYKADISGGPNFAYELCSRRINAQQHKELDLSSWRVAFNGSERVRAKTLEVFAGSFEPSGFRRTAFHVCYGLAESTLIVSGTRLDQFPQLRYLDCNQLDNGQAVEVERDSVNVSSVVSCGWPVKAQNIRVVKPDTKIPCTPGEIGEVWTSGPSVGQGYWNRPSDTEEIFRASLPDEKTFFLRTGDLGFLDKDELFITGRLKDLIIIRGANHLPEEIEETASNSHSLLLPGCAAAFVLEKEDGAQLVLVLEVDCRNPEEQSAIIRSVVQSVSTRHDIPVDAVVLVKPGLIPRTSSGKIQRSECRARFTENSLHSLVLWTRPQEESPAAADKADDASSIELWLTQELARRLDVPVSELPADVPITSLGIDSLSAAELGYSIQRRFTIHMPPDLLLSTRTQAAEEIKSLVCHKESSSAIQNGSVHDRSALSHGENALVFIHRSAPLDAAYNVCLAFRIQVPVSKEQVQIAFRAIVDRHAALRTKIVTRNGMPARLICEDAGRIFNEFTSEQWSEELLQAVISDQAHVPFDLEQGPLFRVLWFNGASHPVVAIIAHHLICDFWSLGIIVQELAALLSGQALPLASSFAVPEYVAWQKSQLEGPEGERLRKYWERQLSGACDKLELPVDLSRPIVQTHHGRRAAFTFDSETSSAIRQFSRLHATTVYTSLLAAFQILLSRYTGQKDFCIGSPFACRRHEALAGMVGYVANTVVLRANIKEGIRCCDFISHVHETVQGAQIHQEYPFSLLVENLQIRRDSSYAPLVQAMFVFHNRLTGLIDSEKDGVKSARSSFDVFPVERRAAQFDLALEINDGDEFEAAFVYNTDLFYPETISRLAAAFQALVGNLIRHSEEIVANIPMLTFDGARQMVDLSTGELREREETNVIALIAARMKEQPGAVALEFAGEKLTRYELHQRASQLANYLKKLGVGREVRVGLCLERSIEMVVAILAVQMAGGAYVPLDPECPAQRLEFMLQDADVKVMLTQERLTQILPPAAIPVICLDANQKPWLNESAEAPPNEIGGDNIAYVIYTSGSTGTPKGVMSTHRGLLNRLLWMQEQYDLTESDCVLQKTPYSFDVSVWEFLWPLMAGTRLVVAKPGGHRDSRYLQEIIQKKDITVLHFVPSMLDRFLADAEASKCEKLRMVVTSGEALTDELRRTFFASLQNTRLENLYGPTEASIDVAWWSCPPALKPGKVPIGRAIANTQLYIVDESSNLQPIGVAGEICIGGVGLARGYAQRSALTAERFVPDQFGAVAGARLYRTGDRGRYLSDGNIEFLGRIDDQIKIRGYRIEPGEIRAVLLQHPVIREAEVIAIADSSGNKRLVGYIVGDSLPVTELRDFMKQRLPEAMLPSSYMWLERMPLSPNGKLDRRALPQPDGDRPELEQTYVAPRTPAESKLVEILSEILSVSAIGVRDNFFELGGHSIALMQLFSRVKEIFGVDVPITLPFSGVFTVESLANYVEQQQISQAQTTDIVSVLSELEELSDEEVQRLLEQELAVK